MKPATPWFIGSERSVPFAGVGAVPMRPDPFRLSRSFPLTTVKKLNLFMQLFSSLAKQPLSSDGWPRMAPLPYWSICPPFSFILKFVDFDCKNFLFLAGHCLLPSPQVSEKTQAHADPVSKITYSSWDGLPNQKEPSYPIFCIFSIDTSTTCLFSCTSETCPSLPVTVGMLNAYARAILDSFESGLIYS